MVCWSEMQCQMPADPDDQRRRVNADLCWTCHCPASRTTSRPRPPLVSRISNEDLTFASAKAPKYTEASYPVHFTSFDLEHCGQRNGIGVVSAENESVGVVSRLRW